MPGEPTVSIFLPVTRARELALAAQRGAGHVYVNVGQVQADAQSVLERANAAERAADSGDSGDDDTAA